MSFLRTLRTVRHLRARQLVGQVAVRLRKYRPADRPPAAPPFPGCRWNPSVAPLPPGAQRNAREDLRRGRFVFLNRREQLGFPPRWESPDLAKLWQYNLHYFEYLWALEYAEAKELVGDWIGRAAAGGVGWEPYPASLRLQNWCAFFFARHRERLDVDAPFRDALWQSLFQQAEWLRKRLEFHLLGNHLLENAAALAMAGACFGGEAAQRWKATGTALLRRELREQMLCDGVHFERSPMYHARVAFLLATLLNVGDEALREVVREPLAAAIGAGKLLRLGDGQLALFNDCALGIYNSIDEVARYAQAAGAIICDTPSTGAFALAGAGYYGWHSSDGTSIVCDAGPVGPDYLPGHAHGDFFSFEMSIRSERVITDSGVFDYEPTEMRRYCRSTAAHNTVEIGGEDQCEFWGAFRVGRRGRPHDVRWAPSADGFRLQGWHDGYHRLPGQPRHERRFVWDVGREALLVRDKVTASRSHRMSSRVHLAPQCKLQRVSERCARVQHDGGSFDVTFFGEGAMAFETSFYCPEFGIRRDRPCIVYSVDPAVGWEASYLIAPDRHGDASDLFEELLCRS